MIEEGFIPISRKLFEHSFWCEDRVYSMFEAWIDLLQSARFENTKQLIKGRLIIVKRGQLPISLRFLASRWGWSKDKVSRFLDLLISESMIKKTANETGQVIVTVCKYDNYNSNSKRMRHQRDSNETVTRRQRDSNETKENKGNKGKKGNNNPLSLELDFVSEEFREAFSLWLDYKKERKEKYKSPRSLKICYNNLVKLSGNNPAVAIEIVNQSIANNWAGLFALKIENNGNKNTANAADSGNIIIRTTDL